MGILSVTSICLGPEGMALRPQIGQNIVSNFQFYQLSNFEGLAVADAHPTDHHDSTDIWQDMTPARQQELKLEDSEAWKQVVGVLLFIISIGLVLAVGTALLSGILSRNL
jgi:hypothetical protein